MTEIKITLETLYDMLRNEKKREDLQKLPDTFFVDLVQYLREKQALLTTQQNQDELFALGERQKAEYEVRSLQRILKQLYELREKKIIDIALNRSRTGSDIIDTSSLLFEEKQFYDQTLNILDRYRRGIVLQLFKCELPSIPMENLKHQLPNSPISPPLSQPPLSPITPSPITAPKLSAITPSTAALSNGMSKIKFIRPVPRFIWKDMKEYGPFDAGESTEIFPEVAELLIRKGRAEKV